MRNPCRIILCGPVVLGLVLGAVAPSGAADKQNGSFWYAVDNISDVDPEARILVWVTLPPEWHGQSVKVSNITPEPAAILEDSVSGNRIIEWVVAPPVRISALESTPTHQFFHYDIEFKQDPVHYQVDPAKVGSYDTSSQLYRRYTAAETWIQTNGKVLDLAREIVGEETNSWLQGGLLYDWLLENLGFVPGGSEDRDAISILASRTGDCGQFSILFTALCRSIGIPSRTVSYVWLDGGAHVFSEVFIPEYGWIPVDIALGQMLMPGGGGMTPEEVQSFMADRGVPSGDPRWFYGNMADERFITCVGNNIRVESPTLGHNLTFQRMQPGGIDATPAATLIEGLNSTIVQGGFYEFSQEAKDDGTAHVLVHQRLASRFFRVGLYDVVEDSCRKTLTRSHDSIQAWMNIGKVHMHKGDYYKAEAAFKRAISGVAVQRNEKMDALIWTHNYLGNCYDLLGHRDMALAEYRIVIDLGNNYLGAVDYARKYLERPFDKEPQD